MQKQPPLSGFFIATTLPNYGYNKITPTQIWDRFYLPHLMIGLVGVSQDTLFTYVTVRQSCKSYRPKLAFSVIGF
ncbi:hypothetical protein MHK07_08820 [Moraxella nonliquefaciens]|nr:hypothetical protein [Moraxella nonliquefaciens]